MASKVLTLIIVLLGLACLATAKKCRAKNPQNCYIEYDAGTSVHHSVLSKDTNSMSVNSGTSQINFSGNCKCIITLWSEPDLDGDSMEHSLNYDETSVTTSEIWDQENLSFEIYCGF